MDSPLKNRGTKVKEISNQIICQELKEPYRPESTGKT